VFSKPTSYRRRDRQPIADALARAGGARYVATHLLIDGFGARDFAPRFRTSRSAGAELLVFARG